VLVSTAVRKWLLLGGTVLRVSYIRGLVFARILMLLVTPSVTVLKWYLIPDNECAFPQPPSLPFAVILPHVTGEAYTKQSITILKTVPWLRLLVTSLLTRTPEFEPGSVHVKFVAGKVTLGQVSLRVLQFSPVNIIPPWLSPCSYIICKVKQSRYTPWRRLGGEEV
jgi:hypothetical protein